jgi:ubiquinone/menaquinone biosynthesis C-methylase UbiE
MCSPNDQDKNVKDQKAYTYRDSHKSPDKGHVYDHNYDNIPWRRFLWSREQLILLGIIEKYLSGRDIELLDFACGTGRIACLLEQRVHSCTGVDVSPSMLAVAREKLERTEIIEADITASEVLRDRKFNLITAFRFFVNAEPTLRTAAIKALAGLLSKDGYLIFNNHQNLNCPWMRLRHWQYRRRGSQGIFNVMTVRQMHDLVESVGLEIVRICPVGFFHPPRVPVSQSLCRVIDSGLGAFKSLAHLAESPIAVCRWRDATPEPDPVREVN